jgi:hypothetical protein
MTTLITLTTADTDTGPFSLYSNIDAYTVPFVTGVSRAALMAGYSTTLVPDGAIIVRVKSEGKCLNYTDISLVYPSPTTTTTTTPAPPVACNGVALPGGAGVTEVSVALDPAGGVVIFQVGGQGVPDKFEIIHNGVKKSTSSMSAGDTNSGPFDNVYGDPTVPPDAASVNGIPQFIGTNKGTVPTRKAEFDAANPGLGYIDLIDPVPPPTIHYQQLIWWKYTNVDYASGTFAILRMTGPSGTAWDTQRLCPTTSTTTTTP